MRLFTSNFSKSAKNPRAISIALKNPLFYEGLSFPELAPSRDMVGNKRLTEERYEELYFLRVLCNLDPQEVAEKLGDGAIMLCWEGIDKPCHRHYVAAWMRKAGIEVQEIPYRERQPKKIKPVMKTPQQTGLFDDLVK